MLLLFTVIDIRIIVTFIFVVACFWPPPLLPRIEFIETRELLFLPHDAGPCYPSI